jgi:hypothetical protein
VVVNKLVLISSKRALLQREGLTKPATKVKFGWKAEANNGTVQYEYVYEYELFGVGQEEYVRR